MLDREQDKAINEARTQAANPAQRSTEYKRDYVAAVVVKHSPGLIHRLSKTKYPADRDVIAGEILRWGREDAPTAEVAPGTTVDLDYLEDIQDAMYNHILQVLTREVLDQDKPNIVADPLSRSAHTRSIGPMDLR
jgi:hypothetical protein